MHATLRVVRALGRANLCGGLGRPGAPPQVQLLVKDCVRTQALFREDAYLRECEAIVTRVDDDGVELDRTVFYPHAVARRAMLAI